MPKVHFTPNYTYPNDGSIRAISVCGLHSGIADKNFIDCTIVKTRVNCKNCLRVMNAAKKLHLQNVNGSAFVIIYQKKPLKNILFPSCDEARNYIKMQHPKRTFKEPKENVFVCSRYGTTFEIVELHYR